MSRLSFKVSMARSRPRKTSADRAPWNPIAFWILALSVGVSIYVIRALVGFL